MKSLKNSCKPYFDKHYSYKKTRFARKNSQTKLYKNYTTSFIKLLQK